MVLIDFKEEIYGILYNACVKHIKLTAQDLSTESVFSYAIYCDSGLISFGGASCTRNGIINHINQTNDDKYLYSETFAAEWNYVNRNHQVFDEINLLIRKIKDFDYDGTLIGIYKENDFDGTNYDNYYQFFIDLIIDVIESLKSSNIFETKPFEQDLLLGLQFGSPSEQEREMVIKVSEKVNSPEWHKKILEAYNP